MVWPLLIGYVVVSQIVVTSWLGFFWRYRLQEHARDAQKQLATKQRTAYKQLTWAQTILFWTYIGTLLLVLSPLILPWSLVAFYHCCRKASKAAKELLSTYQELILDRLHESNIPDDLLEYLDEHSDAPITLGFYKLGDFWLKEEPFNGKARIFLHPDGTTFAEIGVTLDCLYCEATSFLDDGTVIGTANCEPFNSMEMFAENRYYVKAIPGVDLAELLDEHARHLDAISTELRVPVFRIPEANWKPYFHYHNRRFGQIRFEIGEIEAPPEDAAFPVTKNDEEICPDGSVRRQLILPFGDN